MTVYFVHIGKTGGSSIKNALKQHGLCFLRGEEPDGVPETPYGPILVPKAHGLRLSDVPAGDHALFCLRDPVARFVSGFYSRLRKGRPAYRVGWSPTERAAFEVFQTPQQLAMSLVSDDEEERERARAAMSGVKHIGPQAGFLGGIEGLRERLDDILYIGRQETLNADWEQIKSILELPPDIELPSDPVLSHRRQKSGEEKLDERAVEIMRDWYRGDYELLEYCDQVRAERGWGEQGSVAAQPGQRS